MTLLITLLFAPFFSTNPPADSTGKDSTKYEKFTDLPLKPQRSIQFTTTEGTWTSLDVSPEGKTIVFDMMGDLFTLPIGGGTATPLTKGIAFDSHPRWSPDGKKVLFSSDRSGAENIWWIDLEKKDTFQVTKDKDQNFPGATWTPDGDYIVYSKGKMQVQLYLVHKNGGGGIQLISAPPTLKTIDPTVSADGGAPQDIPFSVDLRLELGPQLTFKYPVSDTAYGLATQIRDAVPSADGKRLVFTVLDRLYVMDYPKGAPKRLTNNNFTEAEPVWSRDGKSIVFVTWAPQGGQLWKIAVAGGAVQQLSRLPAMYQSPVFNNDGSRIVFVRTHAQRFRSALEAGYDDDEDELCWMPSSGGEVTVIERANGRSNPHFVKGEDDKIYLNNGNGDLLSIKWDGTDEKTIAHVTGITTFGISIYKNGGPDMLSEAAAEASEVSTPSPAASITMSPGGGRALALINNEIYVASIPRTGKLVNISLADAGSAQFPAKKLTELGGEFPCWEAGGDKVHWSLGNAHFVYDVNAGEAFDDSVKAAKKDSITARATMDSATRARVDSMAKKAGPRPPAVFRALENQVKVYYQRDLPKGAVLLKGARIITMEGDQVIENGDILVENNRITAIGASGSLSAPAGAKVIDVAGKTIVPGFVDTHAHMWPQWGIHKNQVWKYVINLAYGVTTTRDPQTGTTDVLTYADEVDAGNVTGPRIYSTGPGVGFWDYNVKDSAQAESILRQYSKYYNTHYIKMYLTGNRQQRQWIIMAARSQKLMPTTEGGLNTKLNITNLLDGYPGHEHAIPIYPLYNDLVKTIAISKMCVTPTLIVAYGGPFAENYFWETENPYHDAKVQYFMPYEELAGKTRRDKAGWFMPEEQVFPKHARSMKSLVEQGGLAGIGSHGEFNGLGYHWEMWAMGSGGMKPFDVLRVATILGATGLGLDKDLGSLKAGKLADLVVLDANPLENIRNTNTIKYVMKNGRLFDGNTCNEVYPAARTLDRSEWKYDKPVNTTGLKE